MSRQRFLACRSGSTTTEVIGIVVALTLGVAVGFAVRFLPASSDDAAPSEADVIPAATSPSVESQPSPAIQSEPADTHDELTAQLKAELLAELRQQMAHSHPTPSVVAPAAADPEMGPRTLAYWNGLNGVMLREEQMRSVPLGGLTATNARDYLRRRGQAGQFAADAIRKLPGAGVDPDVLAIAADIAAWYERGNELNGMGSFLLNKADTSARQGQPGQQWQDGEKAHQTSVDELNRRGDEIRRRMIEKYGLAFPDLR